ncbi:putative discoidin domain-containing receptor 2-like isoform [Sesbania bispinosa]|nr:putative discoidin domain-containing receptor 2-like isoform [Sesbania bispinosa]
MANNNHPPLPLQRQSSPPPEPKTPDYKEQNRLTRDVIDYTDSDEECVSSAVALGEKATKATNCVKLEEVGPNDCGTKLPAECESADN